MGTSKSIVYRDKTGSNKVNITLYQCAKENSFSHFYATQPKDCSTRVRDRMTQIFRFQGSKKSFFEKKIRSKIFCLGIFFFRSSCSSDFKAMILQKLFTFFSNLLKYHWACLPQTECPTDPYVQYRVRILVKKGISSMMVCLSGRVS